MILKRSFTSETELKQTLDFIYNQSKKGKSFHGLLEVAFSEVTIITAIHNMKSNKGAKTSGIDGIKIDKYLQMNKEKLIGLIKNEVQNYRPKPVKRHYIKKSNGKLRPLGVPTIIERIIQECLRIVIEPIAEAKFYPQSYGFRPYRATKHAIKDITRLIYSGGAQDKPIFAIEGDITGFFDNMDHKILLKKLWKIGVHDKRVIAIIKKMLEAGYMENEITYETEKGAVQGGVISPLLANIYLNDFDWMIGRMYHHPTGYSREDNARVRLKKRGVLPKFLIRYADDWILLTTKQPEAERFHKYLKKYFMHKLKLGLSEEKTVITDLTKKSAKFLGFQVTAGYARASPENPKSKPRSIVGKNYPDMQKVKSKVKTITEEIRMIRNMKDGQDRAIQVEKINAMITGLAEYYKTAICSKAFKYIDDKINKSAFATFKKIYGKDYKTHKVPLSELSNRTNRHKGYKTKTFAVKYDSMKIGITKAFITKSQWERYSFNQNETPYTEQGRKLYVNHCKRRKLPSDRPPLYDIETLRFNKDSILNNFEYFMNREYAFNRDKLKCKICGRYLIKEERHCHRIREDLPMDKINKVPNLAWLCCECDKHIHENTTPCNAAKNIIKKIEKYQLMLYK